MSWDISITPICDSLSFSSHEAKELETNHTDYSFYLDHDKGDMNQPSSDFPARHILLDKVRANQISTDIYK